MAPTPDAGVPDLDSLWDFGDPVASEARFRERLRTVADSATSVAETLTQIARAQGLQGRFEDAHASLDRAQRVPEGSGAARVAVRLLLERGRLWNSAGQRAEALSPFDRALRMALDSGQDALAVDAAHMLALASDGEARLSWGCRALELAAASDESDARRWLASLHHNLGWELHDRGAFAEALTHFELALAEREEQGIRAPLRIARWTVARALRSLGRIEEALARQLALRSEQDDDGYVDEEIAECLLALGRLEEAAPHFGRAHTRLARDAWLREHEGERLARMARLARSDRSEDPERG
jgi:tetratricopeptide (TPR) repeat protein